MILSFFTLDDNFYKMLKLNNFPHQIHNLISAKVCIVGLTMVDKRLNMVEK